MNKPQDLGVVVNDGTKLTESGGGAVATEKDPAVLWQWIGQAQQVDIQTLLLVYISRTHPNADMNLVRSLMNARLANKPN